MTRRLLPSVLGLLAAALAAAFLGAPARADLPAIGATPANRLCRPAILAAERAFGIPDHLLAAIARVESGRRDSASGTFDPWPWTVNADGEGSFYETKAEAIAAVRTMRARGVRSIDVGCMQISLLHHPDAFASLEQAFDPTANATYGARFLSELHARTNAWPRAVEMYHSATPELGQPYGRLVYAAQPAEQRLAGGPGLMQTLSAAWAATMNRASVAAAFRPSPMRIIPLAGAPAAPSPAAAGAVRAGVPGGGMPGGVATGWRTLDSYRALPVRMAFRAP
ncbi:lytic transglycosylase domain-containing protein [Rhodopila sp.]|uniref:lytic transglycosylase domain-containing protein n=1 Tax=Rhodopila sp. TaxID=2480087 RepID=UPI002C1DA66E|nr:lytic transglycosylase domain-containing protein [Rhodopila sp.]HVZ08761.1 lytic transglycosylase domain-containing protein [Rhodopila sp.]